MTPMPRSYDIAVQAAYQSTRQHGYLDPKVYSHFELPLAWVLLLEVTPTLVAATGDFIPFKYAVVWDKKLGIIVEDEVPEYEFWQRKGDLSKYSPSEVQGRMASVLKVNGEVASELANAARELGVSVHTLADLLEKHREDPDVKSKLAAARAMTEHVETIMPVTAELNNDLLPGKIKGANSWMVRTAGKKKNRVGSHTPKKNRNLKGRR